MITDVSIGVSGAIGIPGESGSSLIKIKNGISYTAYGALTFAIVYSKINDWQFYAFKSIIEDDLVEISPVYEDELVKIYPNPVADIVNIESGNEIVDVEVINHVRKSVLFIQGNNLTNELDVSHFIQGAYFL
ncbi:MAG: T9SS type A sorting domain-containing protein [Crocinitomicaceae bacterium]|nr:T9SS type A sorting domain-containing protein [Crocinitomicaceae bacterium]